METGDGENRSGSGSSSTIAALTTAGSNSRSGEKRRRESSGSTNDTEGVSAGEATATANGETTSQTTATAAVKTVKTPRKKARTNSVAREPGQRSIQQSFGVLNTTRSQDDAMEERQEMLSGGGEGEGQDEPVPEPDTSSADAEESRNPPSDQPPQPPTEPSPEAPQETVEANQQSNQTIKPITQSVGLVRGDTMDTGDDSVSEDPVNDLEDEDGTRVRHSRDETTGPESEDAQRDQVNNGSDEAEVMITDEVEDAIDEAEVGEWTEKWATSMIAKQLFLGPQLGLSDGAMDSQAKACVGPGEVRDVMERTMHNLIVEVKNQDGQQKAIEMLNDANWANHQADIMEATMTCYYAGGTVKQMEMAFLITMMQAGKRFERERLTGPRRRYIVPGSEEELEAVKARAREAEEKLQKAMAELNTIRNRPRSEVVVVQEERHRAPAQPQRQGRPRPGPGPGPGLRPSRSAPPRQVGPRPPPGTQMYSYLFVNTHDPTAARGAAEGILGDGWNRHFHSAHAIGNVTRVSFKRSLLDMKRVWAVRMKEARLEDKQVFPTNRRFLPFRNFEILKMNGLWLSHNTRFEDEFAAGIRAVGAKINFRARTTWRRRPEQVMRAGPATNTRGRLDGRYGPPIQTGPRPAQEARPTAGPDTRPLPMGRGHSYGGRGRI